MRLRHARRGSWRRNANVCTQLLDLPRHGISEHKIESDPLGVTMPLRSIRLIQMSQYLCQSFDARGVFASFRLVHFGSLAAVGAGRVIDAVAAKLSSRPVVLSLKERQQLRGNEPR